MHFRRPISAWLCLLSLVIPQLLQGQDVNSIRNAVQELSQAMQKVGASVYQEPGQPPPSEEGPSGEEPGGGEEGTVEGEFREV